MKILFTVLTLLKLAFARFGSHEFPTTGHFGEQLANEYQMILPEHIKIAKAGSLSDVYAIKEISPLVISSGDTITIKYSSTAPYKTGALIIYQTQMFTKLSCDELFLLHFSNRLDWCLFSS